MRMLLMPRGAVTASFFLLTGMITQSCGDSLQQTPKQTIHQLLKLNAGGCSLASPDVPPASLIPNESAPPFIPAPEPPGPPLENVMSEARTRLRQPSRYAQTVTIPTTGTVLANGNILYMEKNLYGLKKEDGTVVIAPRFSYAMPNEKKGFSACDGSACNYYNTDGKKVLTVDYAGVQPTAAGTFIVYTQKGVGVIDAAGNTLVAPAYYNITTVPNRPQIYFTNRRGELQLVPTTVNINFETDKNQFFYRVYTHADSSFLLSVQVKDTLWLPAKTSRENLWYASADYLMIDDMFVNVKTKRKLICEPGYRVQVVDDAHQLAFVEKASEGLKYLIHFDGTLVTTTAFDNIDSFDRLGEGQRENETVCASVRVSASERYPTLNGTINHSGQWIVPPKYAHLAAMGSIVLAGHRGEDSDLLDVKGKKLRDGKYEAVDLENGLVTVKRMFVSPAKIDVIRRSDGEVLRRDLPYSILSIREYGSGIYYRARQGPNETLLNEAFEPVLLGMYREVYYNLQNGAIKVQTAASPDYRREYQLYDFQGRIQKINIHGKEYDTFSEVSRPDARLTYVVLTNDLAWFVLADGAAVPGEARFSTVISANCRDLYITHLYIPENGEINCGIVNAEGKTIMPPVFRNIDPFSEETGLARFQYSGGNVQSGYITPEGEVLFGMEYQESEYMSGGLFKVKKDNRWGVVTRENKVVVPIAYTDIKKSGDVLLEAVMWGKTVSHFTPLGTKIRK